VRELSPVPVTKATPVALAHALSGAGETLVILHGLFGSRRNWSGLARQLSDQFRVMNTDLRNHGHSPHGNLMSLADMAGDVCALIEHQDPPLAAVMGHSLGGRVAMHLALSRPELVHALIVVDVAPISYPEMQAPIAAALAALPLAQLQNRQDADQRLSASIADPRVRAFLLQNLVFANGVWRWRFNLEAIGAALADLRHFTDPSPASPYAGPSLFLRGATSNYVLPEHAEAIRARFPKAIIETIASAGHWPHADQPEAFLGAVRDFLTRNLA
jgi:pimeloyl-ACP methyl ester carboxylesterase